MFLWTSTSVFSVECEAVSPAMEKVVHGIPTESGWYAADGRGCCVATPGSSEPESKVGPKTIE
jgi:hypothetical protein